MKNPRDIATAGLLSADSAYVTTETLHVISKEAFAAVTRVSAVSATVPIHTQENIVNATVLTVTKLRAATVNVLMVNVNAKTSGPG